MPCALSTMALEACVPVVSLFSPIVRRALIRIRDRSNPLDIFDAVFGWNAQPQGRSVLDRQRRSVHFIAQQRLRVEGTRHIESHIVFLAGRLHTYIAPM